MIFKHRFTPFSAPIFRVSLFFATSLLLFFGVATSYAADSPQDPSDTPMDRSEGRLFSPETYYLAGLRVSPGFFQVSDMKRTLKYKRIEAYNDYFAGAQIQGGVMQSFSPEFDLSGELFLGGLFVNESNLIRGYQTAGLSPNLGVEMVVRYTPAPETTLFYLACSLGAQWIFLSDRSYTAFEPSLRIGWKTLIDNHMLLFELGYTTPFISGISEKSVVLVDGPTESELVNSRLHQVFASIIFAI